MRRALFVALLAGAWVGGSTIAHAKPKKTEKKAEKKDKDKDKDADKDADASDDSASDDSGGGDEDTTTTDDSDDSAPKKKGKAKAGESDDAEPKTSNQLETKQDLTGHDLGTKKKTNEFEKDRFFVDKVDTEKTEDATLIQGSLTSTSFIYHETGDKIGATGNTTGSPFSRMFTDLRLQTDFRHIKASKWEARLDARLRFTADPGINSGAPYNPTLPTATQAGFNGTSEYDLRELWLIRNGVQTDVIIGRQFIPDLGGLKIDGMRIDYASSTKVTLLGFAGAYPLRGSRSITTDYTTPLATPGATMDPAGPIVGATGFGGAYRTPTTYGAVGGVALIPLKGEEARVYATSNGYWRYGSTLDVYHFALIDLVGSAGAQLTNLSAGMNIKPSPRLRLTASVNHVDTETLNIQANAFLMSGDLTNTVQNQVAVSRLSTNEARGSVSAGLGQNQRVEVTTAISYRLRPEFQLRSPTGVEEADIPAAKSVEVYGSITDRHSFKDARIGIDGVQTFGTGQVAFQRTKFFAMRVFAAHAIKDGQGEWEADVSYSTSVDSSGGACQGTAIFPPADVSKCFGFTNGTVISAGGTAYYRFNRDWFGIGSLYLTQTSLKEGGVMGIAPPADPDIIGASGLVRLAYRF